MWPAIHVAGVELRLWPLTVTAGVLLCWVLLLRRTRALGYRPFAVFSWVLLAFPVGALCAAALSSLVVRVLGQSAAASGGRDGLTITGSVIGCATFSAVYVVLVFRERRWQLLDAVAFTFGLSTAIGRLGCLLHGCCFGRPASFSLPPLTVAADRFSAASEAGLFHRGDAPELWNLALLLSLNALVAMALAEFLWRRRVRLRLPDGVIFFAAIAADSVGRLMIEWVREEPRSVAGVLNPWQAITLAIACAAGAGLAWRLSLRASPRCA